MATRAQPHRPVTSPRESGRNAAGAAPLTSLLALRGEAKPAQPAPGA
ncbi:hypothetical protein GGQ83_003095 [Roseococcus suduntuyensis]|uniref:Uncharacterized protein n=1 Tax=Roseococcus suduntuyensis TaxID=455361 RepID=A0A840AHS7_9PROT|nr:hypothetical protein [Roseococcus suduntuyensis]